MTRPLIIENNYWLQQSPNSSNIHNSGSKSTREEPGTRKSTWGQQKRGNQPRSTLISCLKH